MTRANSATTLCSHARPTHQQKKGTILATSKDHTRLAYETKQKTMIRKLLRRYDLYVNIIFFPLLVPAVCPSVPKVFFLSKKHITVTNKAVEKQKVIVSVKSPDVSSLLVT